MSNGLNWSIHVQPMSHEWNTLGGGVTSIPISDGNKRDQGANGLHLFGLTPIFLDWPHLFGDGGHTGKLGGPPCDLGPQLFSSYFQRWFRYNILLLECQKSSSEGPVYQAEQDTDWYRRYVWAHTILEGALCTNWRPTKYPLLPAGYISFSPLEKIMTL